MGKKASGVIGGVVGGFAGFYLGGGPAGAVQGAGAGYSLGAGMDAADEGVKVAKEERRARRAQAGEIYRRARINIDALENEQREFEGKQITAFASGNVDLGSASTLLALENAKAQYDRDVYETDRQARFDADQVIRTGEAGVKQARSDRRAAVTTGVVGLVQSGIQAYANRSGKEGDKKYKGKTELTRKGE